MKGRAEMDSRKLEDCSVPMQACLAEFEEQMRGQNIAFVRACTYRDTATQDALFAQGRTRPGLVVTWLKGGMSLHNDMLEGKPAANAADYYPLLNGKLCGASTDVELALWAKMGQIAANCGLEWGGNWSNGKRDMPHVQLKRTLYLSTINQNYKG
jgi:peptidoglycan LD-endopeptidase CwlK